MPSWTVPTSSTKPTKATTVLSRPSRCGRLAIPATIQATNGVTQRLQSSTSSCSSTAVQVTAAPTVTLALTATDNAGGSGMAYMYMVEHTYSSTARQWVRQQETGWMPYTGTHTFQLSPLGGIHYVQAWVGDAAGNIVRTAERAQINYTQASETMLQGQVQVYRYELAAGETLQARLTTTEGDCDLYVWDRQGKLAGYSNNAGTDPDTVPVASPQGGMYQVELRAYTDCVCHLRAEYRYRQLAASQTAGQVTAAGKELPTAPVVATTNLPDDQHAVPAAPPYDSAFLFLPAASRWVSQSHCFVRTPVQNAGRGVSAQNDDRRRALLGAASSNFSLCLAT